MVPERQARLGEHGCGVPEEGGQRLRGARRQAQGGFSVILLIITGAVYWKTKSLFASGTVAFLPGFAPGIGPLGIATSPSV